MDTPEKNAQINVPLSKFEDSPVFNYINSLSPIKPVKSVHFSQPFQSLSFASLPSIFTSPHVSIHKESRFLRRHNYGDSSKDEVSTEDANVVCSTEVVDVDDGQVHQRSSEIQENSDPRVSLQAAPAKSPSDSLNPAVELSQTLKDDCGSPNFDPTPSVIQTEPVLVSAITLEPLEPSGETSQTGLLGAGMDLHVLYPIEQRKEATECDWENLILDTTDLLIFNSPIDTETFKGLTENPLSGADFCTSDNEEHKMQIVAIVSSVEETQMEDGSTQPGGTTLLQEINQTQENLSSDNHLNKCMDRYPSGKVDGEVGSSNPSDFKAVHNLHRGMRRRCLDFEMTGARKKNIIDSSNSSSSMLVQSDKHVASENKKLVPVKPGTESSRCILTGIGLHLNALAITSKDSKNIKHEVLSSSTHFPSSTPSLHSPTTGQELDKSLNVSSTERDINSSTNNDLLVKDASQPSACVTTEEPILISPKKKRRKLEGEGDTCKRCNCKKSKCLKLYCECFAAGVYCIEPCSCQDCFNKPIHEDTVLATRKQIESRNPLAFAPKVIRSSESVTEVGDESSKTPASARHKRGCNCKKSNCLKKYCECFQGGVGCSIGCRCEGCKNTFGRKDGSAPVETEAEPEDDAEAGENSTVVDKAAQKIEIQNEEEQNPNSAIPMTPMSLCRTSAPLPFSSKSKPARSFLSIGSSSGLYAGQIYGKPNIIRSQSKFDKQIQTVPDYEIPEILGRNYSPSTGIKTLSPNSKRVSPPQNNFGSSPGLRSGRKLILQSIPSFPSLTPHSALK